MPWWCSGVSPDGAGVLADCSRIVLTSVCCRPTPANPVQGEALPAAHKFVRLQPLDTRVPWIMIPVDDAFPADVRACPSDHAYELFACHIDEWQQQGRFPRGHITKRFGSVGDVEAETAALLHVSGASGSW